MKNFTVFWNDEKTAYVDLTGDKVKVTRYVIHPVKQIFAKDELTRYEFGEVLTMRCWDRNRDNISEYLDKLGIDEFNPYKICEHTHGAMYGSNIWFLFDGENLTSEDVLGRLK
jgi:hypothetical protein